LRLSQCKVNRRYNIPKSDERRYFIQCCSYPEKCQFYIRVQTTKEYGDIITDGNGVHTCDYIEHYIEHCISKHTSPASCVEFLCKYIKKYVRQGIVSCTNLQQIVLQELKCEVSQPTMLRAKNESYEKYIYNDENGFNLLNAYVDHINSIGGDAILDTILVDDDNNHLSVNTINFLATDINENFEIFPNNDGDNNATATQIIRGELDIFNNEDDYIETIDDSNVKFRNNRNNRNNVVNNNINIINNNNNHHHHQTFNNSDSHRFFSMFVCIKEQRNYASYIKYMCLDATFLTSRYGGILMSASTLDANGKLVILAQGIVPSESSATWLFFIYHLKKTGLANYINFIISDRDKGLINAVTKLFPNIPHAKCLRHLAENFRKIFGQETTTILKYMGVSNTHSIYSFYRRIIYEKKGQMALDWIDNATPTTWCRALFPVQRYGVTTSNTIEIVFAALRKAKTLPYFHIFLFMERYVLEKRFRAYKQYQKMVEDGVPLVPKAMEFLEKETAKSTGLRCIPTGDTTATVEEYTVAKLQHYSISVTNRTCSCNRYQENDLPCRHVICFLRNILLETPTDHADSMYHPSTLVEMYRDPNDTPSIATTIDMLHKLGEIPIVPPPPRVKRGRKRNKRIESQSTKRNGNYGERRCPICSKKGHFQKTCPTLLNNISSQIKADDTSTPLDNNIDEIQEIDNDNDNDHNNYENLSPAENNEDHNENLYY
jgi:MULE transposase domain/SWIM zinc finger